MVRHAGVSRIRCPATGSTLKSQLDFLEQVQQRRQPSQ